MNYILFLEETRHTKTKTALLVPCCRECSVYILKSCLQITQVFADLTLQADICIVITCIISAEIKVPECFHIPFLVLRLIAVFAVQGNVKQGTFARIIKPVKALKHCAN